MVARTESTILERLIEPALDDLNVEAARAILRIKFPQSEIDHMNELAELARQGALSESEKDELDLYNKIGHVVAILQSKARMALKKPHGR